MQRYFTSYAKAENNQEFLSKQRECQPFYFLFWLAAAFACYFETRLYVGVLNGGTFIDALWWHMAISLTMWLTVAVAHFTHRDIRLVLLLALFVTVSGVFGAWGAVLFAILYWFYAHFAVGFMEWFANLFPEENVNHAEDLYERMTTGRDEWDNVGRITPIIDILSLGVVQQRLRAVAQIGRYFQPSLAPALKMALDDENNAVRVEAASVMARVEAEFSTICERLEAEISKDANDVSTLMKLATLCDDFAYSKLFDDMLSQDLRDKALSLYHHYLARMPGDLSVMARIGRLHIRSGDMKTAHIWLRSVVEQGNTSGDVIVWYMDVLFSTRRIRELRQLVIDFSERYGASMETVPEKMRELVKSWQEGVPAAVSRIEIAGVEQ